MNCALPFCAFVGLNLLMGLSNGTVKGTPSGGVGLCDMKRSAVHIRQGFLSSRVYCRFSNMYNVGV